MSTLSQMVVVSTVSVTIWLGIVLTDVMGTTPRASFLGRARACTT